MAKLLLHVTVKAGAYWIQRESHNYANVSMSKEINRGESRRVLGGQDPLPISWTGLTWHKVEQIQGGRTLGVSTNPNHFGGPQHFIKREEMSCKVSTAPYFST